MKYVTGIDNLCFKSKPGVFICIDNVIKTVCTLQWSSLPTTPQIVQMFQTKEATNSRAKVQFVLMEMPNGSQ